MTSTAQKKGYYLLSSRSFTLLRNSFISSLCSVFCAFCADSNFDFWVATFHTTVAVVAMPARKRPRGTQVESRVRLEVVFVAVPMVAIPIAVDPLALIPCTARIATSAAVLIMVPS